MVLPSCLAPALPPIFWRYSLVWLTAAAAEEDRRRLALLVLALALLPVLAPPPPYVPLSVWDRPNMEG
jgi:hypothetical protein